MHIICVFTSSLTFQLINTYFNVRGVKYGSIKEKKRKQKYQKYIFKRNVKIQTCFTLKIKMPGKIANY
jgi:hypothetical protein